MTDISFRMRRVNTLHFQVYRNVTCLSYNICAQKNGSLAAEYFYLGLFKSKKVNNSKSTFIFCFANNVPSTLSSYNAV